MADARRDMDVGRIAGEPHAGKAILHDVEGLDHDRRETRSCRAGNDLTLERALGAEHTRKQNRCGDFSAGAIGASSLASEPWLAIVAPRPKRSALRLTAMTTRAPNARATETGIGLTSAPSTNQRRPTLTGGNIPGQRVGSTQRQCQRTARQPHLVAGADLGRDCRETDRQILDQRLADRFLEACGQPAPANQAGAANSHIEITDDPPPRQRARPFLQRIELAGRGAAADHSADRRADDDVRNDAARLERMKNADMGETARRAATQHQADQRTAAFGTGAIGSIGLGRNSIDGNGFGFNNGAINVNGAHLILMF